MNINDNIVIIESGVIGNITEINNGWLTITELNGDTHKCRPNDVSLINEEEESEVEESNNEQVKVQEENIVSTHGTNFYLEDSEKEAITFSLSSMVSWSVTKAALACVRETPDISSTDGGIDVYNDFFSALDAAVANTDFFSKTGQAPRASNKERLKAWLGFAEMNGLELDTVNNLKFLMESTESNRYSNEQIEQLAGATGVDQATVWKTNEAEVKENQEKLRKHAIEAIELIANTSPNYEISDIEEELRELIVNACKSSRKGIGKRRGSFSDKMSDLSIIKTIEDRF